MADLTVAGTTSYPGTLDTTTTITDGPTGSDQVAAQVNGSAAAAVAIETELGVQPRGTAATVQARLDRGVASAGTLMMTGSSLGMTLGNGDIWIGSAASNSMALSRLNAGQGLTITHGAHSTTIAMTSLVGTTVATQAQMETATDLVDTVTAGRVRFNPGVAKAWCAFQVVGTVPTVWVNLNVSSVGDNGVGDFTANFTTAFSAASYAFVGHTQVAYPAGASGPGDVAVTAFASASTRFTTKDSTGANEDDHAYNSAVWYGDQ